jgi:S-adenosylmethionine decarboxylase proenzyme
MQTIQSTTDKEQVEHPAVGTHLLVTFKDCAANILDCETSLRALAHEAATATRATVLQVCSHKFSPQGVTALIVLAESHASLHTYPESNIVFWDCFTCGTICDPELSISVLTKALKPKQIDKQVIIRG